jgi:hypothetical protein
MSLYERVINETTEPAGARTYVFMKLGNHAAKFALWAHQQDATSSVKGGGGLLHGNDTEVEVKFDPNADPKEVRRVASYAARLGGRRKS